jgi:hypothetical protein
MTAPARVLRGAITVAATTLAALAMILFVPTAANAAPGVELSINGAAFTTSPGAPLLTLNNLAPGQSSTGTIGVRNGYGDGGDLALQTVDVHNLENGCNHPELLAGDTTCGNPGDGDGELGDAFTLTVQFGDSIAGPWGAPVFTGTVNALKAVAHLGVTVPGGADRYLLVTATLPAPTGNQVQTDSISFDLRVNLSTNAGGGGGVVPGGGGTPGGGGNNPGGNTPGGDTTGGNTGGAGVGGVAVGPGNGGSGGHGPSSSGTGGLAITGVPVLMWGAAGVLLLCCGLLLVSFARDRRDSA